jgi:hypothetical protein
MAMVPIRSGLMPPCRPEPKALTPVRGSLSIDQLVNECLRPRWGDGIMPHPVQNLCMMRALVEDAFDDASPGCLLASSQCIVVLVADGVSFDVARTCWSPSTLGALTSTFPSTSSTALLSATTGRAPAEHGVVGVAFYDPEIDAVFDCYRDAAMARPGSRDAAVRENGFRLGPWPTVFTALKGRVDCVAHVGAMATLPGRWSRAVVHGARVMEPRVDWNAIGDDPTAMVAAVAAEIEATLAERRPAPLLVWAHVNLDSAIHARGYDAAVRDATAELGAAAQRWASQGHTVIAHSDHGLVETHDSNRARRLLALLRDPAYCREPSGGAGRVIWAYPHRGSADELLERARELAGSFAAVIHRDELFRSGAVGDTQVARDRIGEVVVVATGREFPLVAPHHRFEHGALSEQEMAVPLAIWMGR